MPIENLPGYKDALALGYTLVYYSGNFRSATYSHPGRPGVSITTRFADNNAVVASLLAVVRAVEIRISDFTFPHPNFKLFETQIWEAYRVVTDVLTVTREP